MATWIVHLRLADALLSRIPGLDPPAFAVGNIAPDSGIPDERWEQFTPPPEVSHLCTVGAAPKFADLEFYRRYLPAGWPAAATARDSFLVGYFFHLVTDNLWDQEVFKPARLRYRDELEQDANFMWKIKDDWYGLDLLYVRDHPDSLFWRVFLRCSYPADWLDFMPPEAVQQRIAYIQDKYCSEDQQQEAAQRPYIYLSPAEMDQFVDRTAGRLYEIYTWLMRQSLADLQGHRSVLEFSRAQLESQKFHAK